MKHFLMCIHCDYYGGSRGYSEMTPGSNASLYCRKKLMRHAFGENLFEEAYSREELREALQTAEKCPEYSPEPLPVAP